MVDLKTTFSEGDVFSAGSTVDNDKLNGITNEVNRKGVIHRKVYTSATEIETTATTITDSVKTFTLAAPTNSLILSIGFFAELNPQSTTTGRASATLKFSGTNLGTKYLGPVTYGLSLSSGTWQTISLFDYPTSTGILYRYGENSYGANGVNTLMPIKILDNSTTVTICFWAPNGGTSKLRNARVEIVYVENFEEDA